MVLLPEVLEKPKKYRLVGETFSPKNIFGSVEDLKYLTIPPNDPYGFRMPALRFRLRGNAVVHSAGRQRQLLPDSEINKAIPAIFQNTAAGITSSDPVSVDVIESAG